MKTYKIIVVLSILLTVSVYANDEEVTGFTEEDCDGDSHTATSLQELIDLHKDQNSDWKFKSYYYTNDSEECLPFEVDDDEDMEEIVVIGIRLPNIPTPITGGFGGGVGGSSNISGDSTVADEYGFEENQKQLDCWYKKLMDLGKLQKWFGEYTDAKYTSPIGHSWSFPEDDDDGPYGSTVTPLPENVTSAKDASLTILIYPQRIYKLHQETGIPFNHLIMYAQMEELVHALQAAYERTDDDKIWVPDWSIEQLMSELEAKETVEDWWKERFGVLPPFLAPENITKPEGYDKNLKRYYELYEKQRDSSLEPEEQTEFDALVNYFEENNYYPYAVENSDYQKTKIYDCDE